MSANFASDLAAGQQSELLFFEKLFPSKLERTDGRKGDFRILKTGELLELKSDNYDYFKTPNFFIERYSYDDKPGGPFQSLENGVKYYCYFFPNSGHFFLFDTELLVRHLNWRFADAPLVPVKNKNYVTRGYKIERALLAHLIIGPQVLT